VARARLSLSRLNEGWRRKGLQGLKSGIRKLGLATPYRAFFVTSFCPPGALCGTQLRNSPLSIRSPRSLRLFYFSFNLDL